MAGAFVFLQKLIFFLNEPAKELITDRLNWDINTSHITLSHYTPLKLNSTITRTGWNKTSTDNCTTPPIMLHLKSSTLPPTAVAPSQHRSLSLHQNMVPRRLSHHQHSFFFFAFEKIKIESKKEKIKEEPLPKPAGNNRLQEGCDANGAIDISLRGIRFSPVFIHGMVRR